MVLYTQVLIIIKKIYPSSSLELDPIFFYWIDPDQEHALFQEVKKFAIHDISREISNLLSCCAGIGWIPLHS